METEREEFYTHGTCQAVVWIFKGGQRWSKVSGRREHQASPADCDEFIEHWGGLEQAWAAVSDYANPPSYSAMDD